MEVGLRVVRGPDWEWGDQDGGEGHVGTVVEVEEARAAIVLWDCGQRCRYRCGVQGKYDLSVFDGAPTGLKHQNIVCTWCDAQPVYGMLWKCANCFGYYLCTQCYMADKHSVDHPFDRCDFVGDLKKRVRLQTRYNATKRAVWGVFPGAVVTRGCDWQWEHQDGGLGNKGKVTQINGWRDETARSVAEVVWNGHLIKNLYRVGHNGKVDLTCTVPASGGYYYPEHLPVLGSQYIPPESPILSAGDAVRVELDPDVFKIAQEEHGGWNDRMAEYIGRVGVIATIQECGDIVVRYSNNKILLLNKDALTNVDIPVFGYGDVVRVIDDVTALHDMQRGHGEWNDDMTLALGQVGRVVKVRYNSDVLLAVNGRRWVINPKSLIPAPNEVFPEETSENIHVSRVEKIDLLLLTHAKSLDVVVKAAAAGDVSSLVDYLKKNPHEVNTVFEGECALHVAIHRGYLPVVKAILQFNPDLEIEDDEGSKLLHICTYVNNGEAANLLIEAGANVNSKDSLGSTPIALSAALGHHSVLNALLANRGVNIDEEDSDGKTPLHNAAYSQQRHSVRLLLKSGADPTLYNFSLFTALHKTAGFGFLAGLEEFLRYHPEHINLKKDDGYTPLHTATANGHSDLVSLLASHPSCDVNIRSNAMLTPLHIAVHEGHVRIVERLVGFGADLNVATKEGNTALHLALGRKIMSEPDERTPFIKKIQDEIEAAHGKGTVPTNVIVGIFLVAQGADVHTKNVNGISPLQIRAKDVSALIASYRGRKDSFHGSLRHLVRPFTEPPREIEHRFIKIHSAPVIAAAGRPLPLSRTSSTPEGPRRSTTSGHPLMFQSHVGKRVCPPMGGAEPSFSLDSLQIKERKRQDNMMNNETDLKSCFLCEGAADMKLEPCGHVTMCHQCVQSTRIARKCPQSACRVAVTKCIPVCVLCYREQNLTPWSRCGHTYCPGCQVGKEYCIACQMLSEKEN